MKIQQHTPQGIIEHDETREEIAARPATLEERIEKIEKKVFG